MMEGYNYTEIGMLAGTAIGGMLAVTEFIIWNSFSPVMCVVFGVCLGILTGRFIDKRFIK
ncbi:hypothetical protein RBH29_06620 [Herbivorax sp. ANBcel31]|uniref:hypothetical protein n=1 Tax=Herbivorax sp. ANBcel31 TaxID=3069754 RepID=UPI0027B863FA|nr:hypothetical protein [Herbivorax sp. ANBcel31]MDQ2086106.1 hypothetical protein [Herbivorax sp. ANBcel31]